MWPQRVIEFAGAGDLVGEFADGPCADFERVEAGARCALLGVQMLPPVEEDGGFARADRWPRVVRGYSWPAFGEPFAGIGVEFLVGVVAADGAADFGPPDAEGLRPNFTQDFRWMEL